MAQATNVKNLTEFRDKLSRIPARVMDLATQAEVEIAGRAFRMIVQTTPVKTGRARGNWKIAFNRPDNSYDPDLFDKSGSITIANGLTTLLRTPRDVKFIIICNGVPYVRYLEYGSSRQAPQGMVRRAFLAVRVSALNLLRAKITGLRGTLFR